MDHTDNPLEHWRRCKTAQERYNDIPTRWLFDLDFENSRNGFGDKRKYCPYDGRQGGASNDVADCICDRWWKCDICGHTSNGDACATCDTNGPTNIQARDFVSLPNPYREAWKLWKADGPFLHTLKSWPEDFAKHISGHRTCEVRVDDRGFAVGDYLRLVRWDQNIAREFIVREITDLTVTTTRTDRLKRTLLDDWSSGRPRIPSWIESWPHQTVVLSLGSMEGYKVFFGEP